MRSVRSYITVVLSPFRIFKKLPRSSFVAGLIFGAIFSFIVNVITIQVTDTIQKQRILEAIENEIRNNVRQAERIIDSNTAEIETNEPPNLFHSINEYSRDVWESPDPLRYMTQLDPNVQTEVTDFYAITLNITNQSLKRFEGYAASDKVFDCYFPELSKDDQVYCLGWYQDVLSAETIFAERVRDDGNKALTVFHPTDDRRNNVFLRTLMGK